MKKQHGVKSAAAALKIIIQVVRNVKNLTIPLIARNLIISSGKYLNSFSTPTGLPAYTKSGSSVMINSQKTWRKIKE